MSTRAKGKAKLEQWMRREMREGSCIVSRVWKRLPTASSRKQRTMSCHLSGTSNNGMVKTLYVHSVRPPAAVTATSRNGKHGKWTCMLGTTAQRPSKPPDTLVNAWIGHRPTSNTSMNWRSGLQQWSHPSTAWQVWLGENLPRPYAYPHKSLSYT